MFYLGDTQNATANEIQVNTRSWNPQQYLNNILSQQFYVRSLIFPSPPSTSAHGTDVARLPRHHPGPAVAIVLAPWSPPATPAR